MAKIFKLTQRSVEAAACPAGRKDALLFDGELRGFGLRVTAGGSKTFLAQYNAPAGKRRLALGAFGVLTVEEARRRAKAILGAVADGRDPFAERRAAAEAEKAAEAAAKQRTEKIAFTFGRLIDAWQKARAEDRRPAYINTAAAALRKNFAAWLDRPACDIKTSDTVRALDGIKESVGPIAANRALAYGRAAYGWAERRQMLAANPFRGVEQPSRERSRDRVLSGEEIGAIWRAAGNLSDPYEGFVRFLILTLQRREECAGMRWAELDDMAAPKVWTVPAERAKNGRAHAVHLSEPARAILLAQRRIDGCPFVFPAASGKSISAFSAAKRRLDATLIADRRQADTKAAPLPDWTMHDFRRAGVTSLAGLGFAPHVADRLLNHVTGSISGVALIYQRAEFTVERRAALDAWARHVLAAAEGGAAGRNVVDLPRWVA